VTTWTGTAPTFTAGVNTGNVARLNDFRDAIKATSEALTTYVPSLAGITAIGNGTMTASYQRVNKLVRGHVKITMGSTTTFGATTFLIGLPVATHANWATNCPVGSAFFFDNSVGSATRTAGVAVTVSSTTVMLLAANLASNQTVTNLVPWTWATSDVLSLNFEYESA
jgi:hypothetical protein